MHYFSSIEFLLFHDCSVGKRLVWSLVFLIFFFSFFSFPPGYNLWFQLGCKWINFL